MSSDIRAEFNKNNNEDNVNDIAGNLSVARDKDSILAKLREKKSHDK